MSFLTDILEVKREEIRAAKSRTSEASLRAGIPAERRDFAAALQRGELAVIAEVKRASPSKGLFAPDLDLPRLVRGYEAGGAAAVSVLTDKTFFHGGFKDLAAARILTSLPLLRKDFIIDPYQVAEAAYWGADAVLLIAACLSARQLAELLSAARELRLAALVEVHAEPELNLVIPLRPEIIGLNNRDLTTFAVDPATSARLRPLVPAGTVIVAESGIAGPADAQTMARLGMDAILVGEALVKSVDPAALIHSLRAL